MADTYQFTVGVTDAPGEVARANLEVLIVASAPDIESVTPALGPPTAEWKSP